MTLANEDTNSISSDELGRRGLRVRVLSDLIKQSFHKINKFLSQPCLFAHSLRGQQGILGFWQHMTILSNVQWNLIQTQT